MKRDYIIFSQKLAGELMSNGFRLVSIDKNNNDNRKFIFIFKETDELLKFIEEYKRKLKT